MKLYSLLIYNSSFTLVNSFHKLDDINFFFRNQVKNGIELLSDKIIKTLESDKYYKITEKISDIDINIYCYCHSTGNYTVIITDNEYPSYVAFDIINSMKQIKNLDTLQKLWEKYQDPKECDKLTKIKTELDETKIVLLESINKLVERGEKIKELQDRTEDLMNTTNDFRIRIVDMNKCCHIL